MGFDVREFGVGLCWSWVDFFQFLDERNAMQTLNHIKSYKTIIFAGYFVAFDEIDSVTITFKLQLFKVSNFQITNNISYLDEQ